MVSKAACSSIVPTVLPQKSNWAGSPLRLPWHQTFTILFANSRRKNNLSRRHIWVWKLFFFFLHRQTDSHRALQLILMTSSLPTVGDCISRDDSWHHHQCLINSWRHGYPLWCYPSVWISHMFTFSVNTRAMETREPFTPRQWVALFKSETLHH